ncbi:GroES-like protein [Calocera cornea HHB12733]|uniref:GroES-like protein n=1 Tax=Calocera cornea HHB12733 TaxID=1353952 RepID=A0A165DFN3_9BASI|nr:GroES-like protein [Calocera cornea HHB12733]
MSTKTMKALIQTAYGEPADVLKVMTVPVPTIDESSDKILVRVKAVSMNPLDYLIVRGGLKFIWVTPMPAPVGCDMSGVVVKAGRKSPFKPGDEVYGATSIQAFGSLAEYGIFESRNCGIKPKTLSHEEASCLPVVGITSLEAFRRHTGPKDTAFIPAGVGGVGHIALQLAKAYAGFKHTITTVSTAKVEVLKQHIHDVDEVIDYKKVDPATVIPAGSCDFALDQFGKPASYVRYMRKPASGSKAGKPSIISIATPPNAKKCEEGWETTVGFPLRTMLNAMDYWTRLWIPGWIHYDSFFALAQPGDLKTMADLADAGKLKPVIDKVFPLDQALEAYARAETKPAGKVVIRID